MAYEVEFDGSEKTFELVPVGQYDAFINSILEKGEGEGAYLNIRFVVSDGPQKGRSAFTNCSFKKDAVWKLKNLLIASGIAQEGNKGAVKFKNEDLIGRKVGIKVSHEEYNGQMRETVQSIFKLGVKPADGAAAATAAPVPATAGVKRL